MKKKLFCTLLIAALLCPLCISAILAPASGQSAGQRVNTPYEYPVVPGTEEWVGLTSLSEKIEACAVDTDLMASMTTPALLETVLDYPLLVNMLAFNTEEEGIASVSEYFEGLPMLLGRSDAPECMQDSLAAQAFSQDSPPKEHYLEVLIRHTADVL